MGVVIPLPPHFCSFIIPRLSLLGMPLLPSGYRRKKCKNKFHFRNHQLIQHTKTGRNSANHSSSGHFLPGNPTIMKQFWAGSWSSSIYYSIWFLRSHPNWTLLGCLCSKQLHVWFFFIFCSDANITLFPETKRDWANFNEGGVGGWGNFTDKR